MIPLKRSVKAITISLRVDEDDLKQIDLIAEDTGVKRTDVVRAAIQLFLREYRSQNVDEKEKTS